MTSTLIACEELARSLGRGDLRILDASWHLDGRDGKQDFVARHLPGAVFFDLEGASDQASDLPHMLPQAEAFAAYAGGMGIAATDDIVVYDTAGLFSAARVWWMFRVMGARRVRVLDGGLPRWLDQGLPVEHGIGEPPISTVFAADVDVSAVATYPDVRRASEQGAQVLDARSAARFAGSAPEPRAGLRAGHIPGSRSLPFGELLNADGTMKRGADLAQAFRDAGIDPERPVVTTCGSGVTAAILSLGLAELGQGSRLYDGSWADWGRRTDAPVATGPTS